MTAPPLSNHGHTKHRSSQFGSLKLLILGKCYLTSLKFYFLL